MTTTTQYLEFQQQDADVVYANGDFIGQYRGPPSVIVYDSDVVDTLMSTTDTQQTNTNTIVLEQDTNISLAFSYFDQDYSDALKTEYNLRTTNWPAPTFKRYAMYDEIEILQLDSINYDTNFPINIGFMTVIPRFAWVDESGIHFSQSASQYDPDNPADKYYYQGISTGPDPFGFGNAVVTNTFTPVGGPAIPIIFQEGSLEIISLIVLGGPSPNPTKPLPNPYQAAVQSGGFITTNISTTPLQLVVNTQGVTIRAGQYDPNTLAVVLTKLFTQVPIDPEIYDGGAAQLFVPQTKLVIRADIDTYETAVFQVVPDTPGTVVFNTTNTYEYYDHGNATKPKVVIGARKFAIEYGVNGQIFQLSSSHASMYNPAQAGTENIAYFYEAGPPKTFKQVLASTGIVIHAAEPSSFWNDILGLGNNITVPLRTDPNGVLYYLENDLLDKLPTESTDLEVFSSENNRFITDPTSTVYYNTTSVPTNAVLGSPNSPNYSGSHLIIEITGLGISTSNYYDANGSRPYIAQVVSTYNNLNNQITGFSDSSIPYMHRGAPIMLSSSAHLRWLDPQKRLIPTLGPKNTLILRVTHTQTEEELQDIKKALEIK